MGLILLFLRQGRHSRGKSFADPEDKCSMSIIFLFLVFYLYAFADSLERVENFPVYKGSTCLTLKYLGFLARRRESIF